MLLPKNLKTLPFLGLLILFNNQAIQAQSTLDSTVTAVPSVQNLPMQSISIQKQIPLVGGIKNQQFHLTNPATQQRYQIQVFKPNVPTPKQGFSIIYMLDGNAAFPYASVMAQSSEARYERHQKAPPIIVAIGYPIEGTIDVRARTYDYTPPFIGAFKTHPNRPAPQYPQGGAEQFYQFIQQQLKPVIEQHYPINTDNQVLFGHSYGGLFTLYTFLNHPEAFQKYLAASPSIWWNDFATLDAAKKMDSTTPKYQGKTLWMSVGSAESKEKTEPQTAEIKIANTPMTDPKQDSDIERMAAQLQDIQHLSIQTYRIADASHFEAMFPAINLALKLAQNDTLD